MAQIAVVGATAENYCFLVWAVTRHAARDAYDISAARKALVPIVFW